MKIVDIEFNFHNEVIVASEYDGKCDIDDMVNDWTPKHDLDHIVITMKHKKKYPIVLLKDVVANTPSTDIIPKKNYIKYENRYYTFSDIRKTNVAYSGYSVDTPKHRRKKCLNPDKWCELNGILPKGWKIEKPIIF